LNIGLKGKNSASANTFVFHIANVSMTAKPHQFKVPETAKLDMCDFLQT
jgi:hypothetical protein